MTLQNTTNATSSPGSAAGRSPCGGPDSKTPEESGPAPVHVSRFRALAKDRATPMSGTCGPLFTASSPSAVLQRSLESRLRARMDVNGSPEFALTWKIWDMPAGLPICALRASARRISDKDCTGWPTPQVFDANDCQRSPEAMERAMGGRKYRNGGPPSNLREVVQRVMPLAGWPTPDAMEGAGGAQDAEKRIAGGHHVRLQDAVTLASWATPRATDAKCGSEYTENCEGKDLAKDASLAAWATPRAEDAESAGMRHSRGVADTLSAQAGQDASRSNAETGRPAGFRLNPRFSLWLMGYPDAWASCGERAMLSCRNARQSSSRHGLRQQENAND